MNVIPIFVHRFLVIVHRYLVIVHRYLVIVQRFLVIVHRSFVIVQRFLVIVHRFLVIVQRFLVIVKFIAACIRTYGTNRTFGTFLNRSQRCCLNFFFMIFYKLFAAMRLKSSVAVIYL